MMTFKHLKRAIFGALCIAAFAALSNVSNADIYDFNWTTPGSNVSSGDAAGSYHSISSEYDTSTQRLSWSGNFTPGTTANELPNGFTLAISNGPNPKGVAGQLALFYFDASTGTPVLTAYGYNGQDASNTFNTPNPPDFIASSTINPSWINSLTNKTEANGSRTLGFDINASIINAHVSPYTPLGSVFEGAKYGPHIGIWFHDYAGLNTSYQSNGYVASWNASNQGWYDTSNETTTSVTPESSSLVLLFVGLAGLSPVLALRRRK